MNIGLGSFSFSSSSPAGAWAPSGARAKTNDTEQARVRYTIEILDSEAHGFRPRLTGGRVTGKPFDVTTAGRAVLPTVAL